jgi:uncharacterized protein
MQTKHLDASALELKLDSTSGMKFSGYASKFNGVDSYGDTINPGAYKSTISGRERPILMRWNHYGPVIGKWLKMSEDDVGLWVEGELTPGHSLAGDVYASLKHGAVSGMSIGYIPVKSSQLDDNRRLLEEIQLFEISVVEEPADMGAQVESVKSAIQKASTIREIEAALRDSGGFARADACALVARIKSMLQGELAAEEKAKREIAAAFQKFNKLP